MMNNTIGLSKKHNRNRIALGQLSSSIAVETNRGETLAETVRHNGLFQCHFSSVHHHHQQHIKMRNKCER